MDRWNTGFPKSTAVGWSRSGRRSTLSQPALWECVQHAPLTGTGAFYMINGRTDPRAASRFSSEKRVEPTRCRNLRAGWEKALQCRQPSAMGNTVRTFLRDRRSVLLHFSFRMPQSNFYSNCKQQNRNRIICLEYAWFHRNVCCPSKNTLAYALPSSGIFHLLPIIILPTLLRSIRSQAKQYAHNTDM